MARYNSFIKITGSLGGLTFYEDADGQWLVKQKNTKYQPTSPGTLRNNSELGGAASMCKHFRNSFLKISKQFGGQDTCGRLNGKFRLVIGKGSGIYGQRNFDLRAFPQFLIGFQFQKFWSVRQILTDTLLDIEMNETRDLVRWNIPNFVPRQHVKAPEGATHFQLVLVGTQVSPGVYDEAAKSYVQSQPVKPHRAGVQHSPFIALNGSEIDGFSLEVVPGLYLPTPEAIAIVVCAGVVFSCFVNGTMEVMKDGKALDVLGVG